MFDFLIVGAGFAGSVVAERLASCLDARVLIVERRNHVGGNAYDHYDDAGLLVHRYGPHIFHTASADVFRYLSRFTDWRSYQHRVAAYVDGQLVPMPINLDTINRLNNANYSSAELAAYFASRAEAIDPIKTAEDVVVSKVGRELYEKFFRGYTRKQWGIDPSDLDPSVTARIPVRETRDARYFTDKFQAMPRHGYTRMFERMLDHRNIKVMLNADYCEVKELIPYRSLVYTGAIDEFFDFALGKLPYRSIQFRFETLDRPTFQDVPVINYPNDYDYTRVTEFKHLTGQEHPKTTVVYEFPCDDGDPYYPVPRPANAELYRRYEVLANQTPNTHFVGRLATYRYYNMDQVVAQSLTLCAKIAGVSRAELLADRAATPLAAAVAAAANGSPTPPGTTSARNGNGHGRPTRAVSG